MKKLLSKLVIHPIYYLLAFIAVITGNFKAYITISIILFIHELGHILGSYLFKWHIDKVIILPFGCLTKFNEQLNRPIYQEFVILILGPLFQCLLYLIYPTEYHMPLLIFNLLPIYPLDGAKLLFLICNKMMSYYHSYILVFSVSIITMIYFIKLDLIYILIIFYLIYHLYIECRKIHYIMNRFFFERYLYQLSFKKNYYLSIIKPYKMKRGYYHYFYNNGKYYSETEILRLMFDKRHKTC